MSSNDNTAQLEAQLQRACVLKVESKATAEHKVVEDCYLAEEKVAAEVEAEVHWIAEERVVAAAAARWQAILDAEAKCKAEVEEMGMEQGGGSLSKQKERAEGKQIMCDHCAMWGADCQVSLICFLLCFLLTMCR